MKQAWIAAIAASLLAATAAGQAPPPQGFPGEAPPGPPARILSFTAEPAAVEAGSPTTLRWAVVNAYSLTIEPGVGTVATRGSVDVAPTATTTYTLTVTGTGGTKTESITIDVSGSGRAVAGAVPPPAAPTGRDGDALPQLGDGKPDLSGVYLGGRDIHMIGEVRVRPGAESFRVPVSDQDLGQGADCLPPGVPAATMVPYPLQIVQKPDVVVILYEAYNIFRIVPVGRDQPEDLDPTWMGNSVAHWDGDTLVVDVRGFNDKTRVAGFRHTEAMHVVERYERLDSGAIHYTARVEDPNVFATPIEYAGDLVPHPEWEIGEYVCAENNKDYSELFSPGD
jgi:hypothetical protein